MEADNKVDTISITRLCTHYQADTQFFEALEQFGLITLIRQESTASIPVDRIREVEKWIHLHYDLNINMEGLDAIANLLEKVAVLQAELSEARRRISYLERL